MTVQFKENMSVSVLLVPLGFVWFAVLVREKKLKGKPFLTAVPCFFLQD